MGFTSHFLAAVVVAQPFVGSVIADSLAGIEHVVLFMQGKAAQLPFVVATSPFAIHQHQHPCL